MKHERLSCSIFVYLLTPPTPLSAGLTTTTAPPANTETNAFFHTEIPAGINVLSLPAGIYNGVQKSQITLKILEHFRILENGVKN